MDALASQFIAVTALALRLAPSLAFAPPFTLVRVPVTVRVVLTFALSAWAVAANPAATSAQIGLTPKLIETFASELATGLILSLPLHVVFGALLTAGRSIDIQAGFGLAALVDPTTKAQLPLVGSIFSYATGAIFFATQGPFDLLAIWSGSLNAMPLGAMPAFNVSALADLLGSAFLLAFGLGAMIILALFLADLAIAFMSRTMPQMNVLLLGFQVKVLMVLLLLAPSLAVSAAGMMRLIRLAIDAPQTML